jgi:diadenosine tetraphosphate (Ap4A) HIT family hydrolase
VTLERLWAGWRSTYVSEVTSNGPGDDACVMCRILAHGDDRDAYVVRRFERCAVILNAYPYGSGHLMVVPNRHAGKLHELDGDEVADLWTVVTQGVEAVEKAYSPEGVNVGANLGFAAGAGVPGHVHVHVLPRWTGDTNFMTSVAETRVLPEPLGVTYDKLDEAWPT